MEDFDRIIGCSTSWCRFVTNESWITDTSNIKAKSLKIIIAPKLTCIFTDTIYCRRFDNRLLWSIYFRRCRSEYSDAARPIDLMYFFFPRDIQYIQQALH